LIFGDQPVGDIIAMTPSHAVKQGTLPSGRASRVSGVRFESGNHFPRPAGLPRYEWNAGAWFLMILDGPYRRA